MALQMTMIHSEFHTESAVLDELIQRVAASDSEALAELYHRASPAIYGFALSILKNTHDAEDVLHDSFLNIYSAAGNYKSDVKPMA